MRSWPGCRPGGRTWRQRPPTTSCRRVFRRRGGGIHIRLDTSLAHTGALQHVACCVAGPPSCGSAPWATQCAVTSSAGRAHAPHPARARALACDRSWLSSWRRRPRRPSDWRSWAWSSRSNSGCGERGKAFFAAADWRQTGSQSVSEVQSREPWGPGLMRCGLAARCGCAAPCLSSLFPPQLNMEQSSIERHMLAVKDDLTLKKIQVRSRACGVGLHTTVHQGPPGRAPGAALPFPKEAACGTCVGGAQVHQLHRLVATLATPASAAQRRGDDAGGAAPPRTASHEAQGGSGGGGGRSGSRARGRRQQALGTPTRSGAALSGAQGRAGSQRRSYGA